MPVSLPLNNVRLANPGGESINHASGRKPEGRRREIRAGEENGEKLTAVERRDSDRRRSTPMII